MLSAVYAIVVKDFRRARWLLAAFYLLLAMLPAWQAFMVTSSLFHDDSQYLKILIVWHAATLLAMWSAIAITVQNDAPVGDRQSWHARPCTPVQLLAAKLLFTAVFIQLPVLAAQLIVLAEFRVAASQFAPSIALQQCLFAAILVWPVLALASRHARLRPLFLELTGTAFACLVLTELLGRINAALGIPRASESSWLSLGLLALVMLLMSAAIVADQYRPAGGRFRWPLLVAAIVLVPLIEGSLPRSWADRADAAFEPPRASGGAASVEFIANPGLIPAGPLVLPPPSFTTDPANRRANEPAYVLPFRLAHLPPGSVVHLDTVAVEAAGGQIRPSLNVTEGPDATTWVAIPLGDLKSVDPAHFRGRVEFHLTLAVDAGTRPEVLDQTAIRLAGIGTCMDIDERWWVCASSQPAASLWARTESAGWSSVFSFTDSARPALRFGFEPLSLSAAPRLGSAPVLRAERFAARLTRTVDLPELNLRPYLRLRHAAQ
jgi:hypothetical protein